MTAVLPHYKQGPANYQVATLIFGGQLVVPNNVTPGTTDLTVTVAGANAKNVLGVAGSDGNVVSTQSGAANTYGQPAIDISVLLDYIGVYHGPVDIWVWYSGQVAPGALLIAGNYGTVVTVGAGTFDEVVGRCTHPGGVSSGMLTQQIGGGQGGGGSSSYFLGRARIF